MKGFFEKLADGTLVFTDRSKRHAGKTVVDVARSDPKYLRWARREKTIGLPSEIFDIIDSVMTSNGVSFTAPRKARKKKT